MKDEVMVSIHLECNAARIFCGYDPENGRAREENIITEKIVRKANEVLLSIKRQWISA